MANSLENLHRYSLTNNSYLAYRNSAIIAHRLSIYMPNIFLPSKNPQKLILEINSNVAQFRDMLLHVGQIKDNPELREKIRKFRYICVEACNQAAQVISALIKCEIQDDCITDSRDSSYLILLYQMMEIFSKELSKCYRLIQIIPMDMSGHNENRSRHPNFGNILGQILLCKQISPDFKEEELCSIVNDIQSIKALMTEMKSYIPQYEKLHREHRHSMPCLENGSLSKRSGLLCCISRPKENMC